MLEWLWLGWDWSNSDSVFCVELHWFCGRDACMNASPLFDQIRFDSERKKPRWAINDTSTISPVSKQILHKSIQCHVTPNTHRPASMNLHELPCQHVFCRAHNIRTWMRNWKCQKLWNCLSSQSGNLIVATRCPSTNTIELPNFPSCSWIFHLFGSPGTAA